MGFTARNRAGVYHVAYALIFLVIALLASFGMFGLQGAAMEAARILFFVFLVMLVLSFLGGHRGSGISPLGHSAAVHALGICR